MSNPPNIQCTLLHVHTLTYTRITHSHTCAHMPCTYSLMHSQKQNKKQTPDYQFLFNITELKQSRPRSRFDVVINSMKWVAIRLKNSHQ